MIFAQIKDGIIQNTIVINDLSLLDLFQSHPITNVLYDSVLQIDSTYPQPGIGWLFDGIIFSPPPISDNDE